MAGPGQFALNSTTGAWPNTASGIVTTLIVVKGSPGTLGGYYVDNQNGSMVWLQIFDSQNTAGVNLGTTTPKLSIGIPTTGAANLELVNGIRFLNGIVIAATTQRANNTAPGTPLDYNFWFD